MSNIYFTLKIQKNCPSQNFSFLSLRKFATGSISGSSNSRRYRWMLKILVVTKTLEVWQQNCMWIFYYFNVERNYDVFKSKSPCILLNKNINFNKNATESKTENPHAVLERRTLSFSSYKNRKLKVKLWWVGARERKKRAFFVPFTLSVFTFVFYLNVRCI